MKATSNPRGCNIYTYTHTETLVNKNIKNNITIIRGDYTNMSIDIKS